MSVRWQRLHLSKQEVVPPLLYKYSSTSKGYQLYMTDLTNIWSEHLNRQEILKRADEHDTTIDPSEDPKQFEVLLQKIEDALRNEPGSTANLDLSSRGDSLDLTTSIKLPAPLQPLKWTVHLSKEPQSSTTSQLLLPLVWAEADWESHQRSLIDQLHKKDWVLTKLFDKIEAVGIDLSTIFPGISGLQMGKGRTLAQAAKHIKGVAPFDENAWFEEISTPSAGSGLAANILVEASSSGKTNSSRVINPPPDKWWEGLTTTKTTGALTCKESELKTGIKPSKAPLEVDTDTGTEPDDDDDDEFERQETPPRLKQLKGTKEEPTSPEDDDEEEEKEKDKEEREQEPIDKPMLPSRQIRPAKPSKGLGLISGKKKSKAPPQPSPPPVHTSNTVDDQTDSGSEQESPALASHPPAKPKLEASVKVPSKLRGLGVIGGSNKETQATPDQPASPPSATKSPRTQPVTGQQSVQASPPLDKKTKRVGKLGVIGGKTSKRDVESTPICQPEEDSIGSSRETIKHISELTKSLSPDSRQPKAPEQPEQPEQLRSEETNKEKVDRKREELKRQLEAKSKAPARKKRKF